MASARLLAKLVTTAGNISAGAVQALASGEDQPERGLEAVPPLLGLLAESICLHSTAEPEDLDQLTAFLEALIERYGTARRAMDALSHGRRRYPLVSVERAEAWFHAMSVTPGAIEPTLRRHATLIVQVSKWLKDQGLDIETRMEQYQAWLDAPLPTCAVQLAGAAAPAAQGGAESAGGAPPAPAMEAAAPRAVEPVALGTNVEELATGPAAQEDLRLVRRLLVDAKYLGADAGDAAGARQRALAVARLAEADEPAARIMAALARRDLAQADALLTRFNGQSESATVTMLRGERAFQARKMDEACDWFRKADAAAPDALSRMNVAAAIAGSSRGTADETMSEAIDLLTDTLGSLEEGSPDWARVRAAAGLGWMHSGGDRERRFREAIACFEQAASALDAATEPDWWAEAQMQLGLALVEAPVGDRVRNIQKSMEHLELAMRVWTRESAPRRWATLKNHMGHAWERLPRGNRDDNLKNAIGCYSEALTARSREANPVSWARLQNNLGNAWIQHGAGTPEHRQNVERAIACHTAALEVWSRLNRRGEWAATQNNLGNAWALLPEEGADRERNLRRAIACYKSALEVRTRSAHPVEWAATNNNLGTALLHMPPGPRDAALQEAIECFKKALEVRTREAFPMDWAKTQANLGQAWARKSTGDRRENLAEAAAFYECALEVLTAYAHPHQHQVIEQRLRDVRDRMM